MSHNAWTPAEYAVLHAAPDFRGACAALPHRTPGAIAHKWADLQAQRRGGPVREPVAVVGARPPQTAAEYRVAQILVAARQKAQARHEAVPIERFLAVLRAVDWAQVSRPVARGTR